MDGNNINISNKGNQVAYKKRAAKSINNQRDQLVSENIFWSLFIGF